jgi:hypothetical protein
MLRSLTDYLQITLNYTRIVGFQAGRFKKNNFSCFGVPNKNEKPADKNIIAKNINGRSK